MNENNQQIQIKITDEVLKGVYSNLMMVSHNREEFVLDFANIFPPNGIVNARVIISPSHLKRIVAALQDNLGIYEKSFGIVIASEAPKAQIGFKSEV